MNYPVGVSKLQTIIQVHILGIVNLRVCKCLFGIVSLKFYNEFKKNIPLKEGLLSL